jgi:isopentenyl diphosphate isomerase/L-lactate dehydrogenase-like FMN-dependent dehydrogenase
MEQADRTSVKPINIREYEALAQSRLDANAWGYYYGGSDDEVTLRANRTAFERIRLRPRVLVDVSTCDLHTFVLGTPLHMPILIAPTGLHGPAHAEGECETARGAGLAHTLMVVSTSSTRTIEDVAKAAIGPLWYQLYWYNYANAESMIRRAVAAGYRAIVLTVDSPRWGNKERARNFSLPAHLREANFGGEDVKEEQASLTWNIVPWLRSMTSLPIVLKGILTEEDALLAVEHGVDGIVVSNHGGRQLDSVPASIEALPEIVAAVAGRCEVYLDGGIRRGTDILKALSLGARAVLVGRPVLYGLAVNGAEGVAHVLEILRSELELAMVLAGCPDIKSISRSLVKVIEW